MRDIKEILNDVQETMQEYCDNNYIDVSVEFDDDFGYYRKEQVVGITLVAADMPSKCFMDNAFKNGLAYDCGVFLMSFFHEIGHHYTLNWLTKKEDKKCDKIKATLDGAIEEDNYTYFNLIDEKLATDWAIEYINSEPHRIKALAEKLQKLIEEIEIDD